MKICRPENGYLPWEPTYLNLAGSLIFFQTTVSEISYTDRDHKLKRRWLFHRCVDSEDALGEFPNLAKTIKNKPIQII